MNEYLVSLKYFSLMLLRDKGTIIVFLLFPMVIIFILGSVFSSSNLDYKIDKARVSIVTPYLNEELVLVLKSEELEKYIEVYENSEKISLEMLDNDEVDSILYLSSDSTKMVSKDQYSNSNLIIKSVIEGYENIKNSMNVIINEGNVETIVEASKLDLSISLVIEDNITNKPKSAMDYYSVTIIVLMLLYGGLLSIDLVERNLKKDLSERVGSITNSKSMIILGILTSSVMIVVAQSILLVLFTKLFYGVNFGSQYLIIFLVLFILCIFSCLLTIVLFLIFKNQSISSLINVIIIFVITFFSGGYMKIDFGRLSRVLKYLPNSCAQNAIFSSIYNHNVMENVLVLIMYVLILLAVLIPLSRRKVK